MGTTQVAVRMDDEMVALLDWLVVRGPFENRAEVVRRAVEELGRREHSRSVDESIAAGYRRVPATQSEASPDFTVWNQLDDGEWGQW